MVLGGEISTLDAGYHNLTRYAVAQLSITRYAVLPRTPQEPLAQHLLVGVRVFKINVGGKIDTVK